MSMVTLYVNITSSEPVALLVTTLSKLVSGIIVISIIKRDWFEMLESDVTNPCLGLRNRI